MCPETMIYQDQLPVHDRKGVKKNLDVLQFLSVEDLRK